jgi:AcrR family transcriptional regulator
MAKLFRRVFRTVKRRIKQGLRDQRTFNLHQAGVRLLATHDHEQVSVAQLAREAGISVGAFYQRFPNKDAFLGRLLVERMDSARRALDRDLDPARPRHRSARAVTRAIVTAIMHSLHGPGAGVARAALQRGYSDRQKLAPLVSYRTAVADRAVALLAPRVKGVRRPDPAVRATVQIALATSLDALLHDADILRPGHQRMVDVLSTMMLRLLDLPADARPVEGADADDEPAP